MMIRENMARFECTDESCFKLSSADLKKMAERGDARAKDELARREHNRRQAHFERSSAAGEGATDPGFFVPPSLGGAAEAAPAGVSEAEIQATMRECGVSRRNAITIIKMVAEHERSKAKNNPRKKKASKSRRRSTRK